MHRKNRPDPREALKAHRRRSRVAAKGGVLHVGPDFGNQVPKYQAKVEALAAAHRHALRPGLHEIRVLHDDGCPALSGGTCGCDPEVRLVTRDPEGN